MPPPGIEPATPCFQTRRSSHSAIETVNDMLLKFFTTFYANINNQHVCYSCTKLIFVSCVLELSDKICISFTNIDVLCLQNFVWTNQTKINFVFVSPTLTVHLTCLYWAFDEKNLHMHVHVYSDEMKSSVTQFVSATEHVLKRCTLKVSIRLTAQSRYRLL